jgi:LTR polyprotein gag-polypeptide-like protein
MTTHVPGNEVEYKAVVTSAKPWHSGNELALGRIYNALLDQSLHLLLGITYAKNAWECLHSNYQPQNSVRAAVIKGQIMTYHCTANMNMAKWLIDMQHLYITLCSIEVECMTDCKFALAILDLMPHNNIWVGFVSGLQDKLHDADSQRAPFQSVMLISCIWDEYWCWHKDDKKNQSTVFSARFDTMNRSSGNKRERSAEVIAMVFTSTKRQHTLDSDRPRPWCTNPHCARKSGHKTAKCIAYTGAKQGQYPDWWWGPWNIHLPESQWMQ